MTLQEESWIRREESSPDCLHQEKWRIQAILATVFLHAATALGMRCALDELQPAQLARERCCNIKFSKNDELTLEAF